MWAPFQHWFLGLGAQHGVNPLVFGAIYVGAVPFCSLSTAWLVRNLRRSEPLTLPVLSAGCFISAYPYLLIAGRNVSVWVYPFVAAMVGSGVVSTIRKVRRQAEEKR